MKNLKLMMIDLNNNYKIDREGLDHINELIRINHPDIVTLENRKKENKEVLERLNIPEEHIKLNNISLVFQKNFTLDSNIREQVGKEEAVRKPNCSIIKMKVGQEEINIIHAKVEEKELFKNKYQLIQLKKIIELCQNSLNNLGASKNIIITNLEDFLDGKELYLKYGLILLPKTNNIGTIVSDTFEVGEINTIKIKQKLFREVSITTTNLILN